MEPVISGSHWVHALGPPPSCHQALRSRASLAPRPGTRAPHSPDPRARPQAQNWVASFQAPKGHSDLYSAPREGAAHDLGGQWWGSRGLRSGEREGSEGRRQAGMRAHWGVGKAYCGGKKLGSQSSSLRASGD